MSNEDFKDKFKTLSELAQDIMLSDLKVFIPTYINNMCYKRGEEVETNSTRILDVKKTYRILGRQEQNLILIDTDVEYKLFNDILKYQTDGTELPKDAGLFMINENEFPKEYYLLLELEQILFVIGRCGGIEKDNMFVRLQNFTNLEAMKNFAKDEDIWFNSFKLHSLFILFYMNERGYVYSHNEKKFIGGSYNSEDYIIL